MCIQSESQGRTMGLGRELSKHLVTEGVTNVSRRHDWLRTEHEQPDAMGSSDLGGIPEGTLLWLIKLT